MQIKTTETFEKSFTKLYKKDKHLLGELEELTSALKSNYKGKSGGHRVGHVHKNLRYRVTRVYLLKK